jgi:hypothetical protein
MRELTTAKIRPYPFRREFQPPWTGQPQVTKLALNRLDRRDRTALVDQIAGPPAPIPFGSRGARRYATFQRKMFDGHILGQQIGKVYREPR